jgi:hypothetical protein
MSIMRLLEQAQGGQGLGRLADQLGLDADQADSLTRLLAPAIGSAARQRAQAGGLGEVLGALRGEGQAGLFDDAGAAASSEGQAQGRDFLTALLGGSGAADNLTEEAAARTGVDRDIVGQFLPALAAMAQGGLQRQMPDAEIDAAEAEERDGGFAGMLGGLLGGGTRQGSSGGLGMLNDLLDADGDGSALDDVLGRFPRR